MAKGKGFGQSSGQSAKNKPTKKNRAASRKERTPKKQATKKDRATSRKERTTKKQATQKAQVASHKEQRTTDKSSKKNQSAPRKEQLNEVVKRTGKTTSVNQDELKTYQDSLEKSMERPCLLTGIRHFPWEERYRLGQGSETEYELHKKTNAAYTDTFEFLGFEPKKKTYGVHVKVKRVSDRRKFVLPLNYLKTVDRKHPNSGLIADYRAWFDH